MTPAVPTAVVFDLGGVLVDWDPRYLYRSLLPTEAEVEAFLAEVTTPEWNAAQDAGRTWAEAVESLTAEHPQHAALIAAYHERWLDTIGGEIEGTVELLGELRAAGVPLYALTNWSAEKFPLARQRFEWLSWFDGIVVSGEERIVKPDPRIYRVVLSRYHLDAASTVYIDDVGANVDAARAAGMTGLHFTDSDQLRADLVELALPLSSKESTA